MKCPVWIRGLSCKILFGCAMAVFVPWSVFYLFLKDYDQRWMEEELLSQARAIYNLVTTTRQWISLHGGIYIKDDQDKFVLLTPSHFVRELSLFSQKRLFYKIKIAVENPKNPAHKPDEFEARAIRLLKEGRAQEVWNIEEASHIYRYAAPLEFKIECINCHSWPKERTLVGCISLSIPIENIEKEIKKRRKLVTFFVLMTMVIMFFSLSFLVKKLVLNPIKVFKNTTQKIKKGEYAKIEIRSDDEWEELAETFNGMVERIKNHQEELEKKVEEATEKLRKAYEELQKTNQFKSEFFSHITHDLKTPLSAIKGSVDYLLRKYPDEQLLWIARKNVQKLMQMINAILDITRLEHGQLELTKELCDLRELVEEACMSHEPIALEKNTVICEHIPEAPVWVEIDPERMYRVISNLLDNAIKFSPEDSKIDVRLFTRDGRAILEVEDFGPGVRPEDREKIFKKFYQSGDGGLGLGLAISYGIVKAHGGDIWVENPKDHSGAVFVVSIPYIEKLDK